MKSMEVRSLEFEWDEKKRQSVWAERGVDFEFASLIFRVSVYESKDARNDYGEERITAVGYVEDKCYVVVFTRREDVVRIISARRGGRRDRRKYDAYLAGRD